MIEIIGLKVISMDLWQTLYKDPVVQRLFFSFLFGVMIGLERQLRHKMSGIVTNVLVAVGATLFMTFGHEFSPDASSRMAAQVISGMGFLGGGVIIRDGFSVRGLNTAATLWCSAAIGLLCSEGHIRYAFTGTLVILMANIFLKPLAIRLEYSRFGNQDICFNYKIHLQCRHEDEQEIIRCIRKFIAPLNMTIRGMESRNAQNPEWLQMKFYISFYGQDDAKVMKMLLKIKNNFDIISYSYEKEL